MKIAIIIDSVAQQYAGIRYYNLQWAQRFLINYGDHDIRFITTKLIDVLPYKLQIVLPINRLGQLHFRWRYFWTIPRVIKSWKADVAIELAHFGPFFIPKNCKRITFIHDLTPLTYPQFHPKLSVWMHKFLMYGIVRRADEILVNSYTTKSEVENYYPIAQDKITVMYPKYINTMLDKYIDCKNEFGDYCLVVGTIEPRKNYLLLIQAFDLYCDKAPMSILKLMIVGAKGWKNDEFYNALNSIKYRDRVVILGYVSEYELIKLYKNAKFYVSSSHQEGFGLPVLEAMYYNLPLILSDLLIYREITSSLAVFCSLEDIESWILAFLFMEKQESRDLYSYKSKTAFKKFDNPEFIINTLK